MSDETERFTKAVDSVLADEFLTRSVMSAIAPIIEGRQAEAEVLRRAAKDLDRALDQLPHRGRYTRARWALVWLKSRANDAPEESR